MAIYNHIIIIIQLLLRGGSTQTKPLKLVTRKQSAQQLLSLESLRLGFRVKGSGFKGLKF